MRHLIIAGAVLAVFVIAFVGLKLMSPPVFLEKYGFYQRRDTVNVEEWASMPIRYADPSGCNNCHQDKHSVWELSKHSTVSCENCHGPGQAHVETGAKLAVDSSGELCSLCHSRLLARPSDFPQVDIEEHAGQSACITCHNPHNPRIAALPRIPHSLEGRSDCLSCHGPGGLKPVPEDHAGRTSADCLSCHTTE